MKGLDEWKIVWPNAKKVQTHKVQTNSPVKIAAILCRNRIADGVGANYHMFFNSVRGISDVIQMASLKPEDCRIICSTGNKNQEKLPNGFTIGSTTDPPKPINFYTSTCFEGCDLKDPNGYTFIICDPNRPNSLLDISTSMLQICGRIRDSKYKGHMALIFNTTRYEDTDTLEAYKARVQAELKKAEHNAAGLNMMDKDFRKQIIKKIKEFDAPFIDVTEDDEIFVNKDMVNLDIVSYKIVHGIYDTQVNLDAELQKSDFDIVSSTYIDSRFIKLMSTEKMSFRECCEQYGAIKPLPGTYSLLEDPRLIRLRNLCPEACEAVDTLGLDEVRKMKFHRQNIHRKLVSSDHRPQDLKIKREVDLRLNKFEKYTIPEIKKVLLDIYADVGLDKRPVATDLER
jgi:hypothetical protein